MKRHLCVLAIIPLFAHAQWSIDSMSVARCFAGITSHQGKVYIAGGNTGFSPDQTTNRVDIYDFASDTWSIDSLSLSRADVAVGAMGNYLMFAGGIDANGAVNRVEIWNLASQTKTIDSLFRPQGAGVILAHKGKFYVAGGTSNTSSGVTSYVSIYDTLTNTWTLDSLSIGRFGLAGASFGDYLAFAGGYTNTSTYPSTDVVDIYNSSTQQWTTAQLTEARGNINGIEHGSKFYFAGGLRSVGTGALSKMVDVYDPMANSWSSIELSRGRRSIAIAALDELIFFAGGEQSFSGNISSKVVDIYDTQNDSLWADELSTGRDAAMAASVGNKVFVAGSCRYVNNTFKKTIDVYTRFGIGIDEPIPSRVSVYPNPSQGRVTIENFDVADTYQVYNSMGQLIEDGSFESPQIDLSHLPRGVYLIQFTRSEDVVGKARVVVGRD